MRNISQKLALSTYYDDGKPTDSQEGFDELARQAYAEFWETSVGQEFIARGGDDDRLVAVFFQRFGSGVPHPTVPFVERLLEVGADLLVELPEPVAVVQAPVKPVVNLTPAKPIPEASAEVKKYAHLFNEAVLTYGIASTKPALGFVTIKVGTGQNAKSYRYSVAENSRLYDEALKFNLIA